MQQKLPVVPGPRQGSQSEDVAHDAGQTAGLPASAASGADGASAAASAPASIPPASTLTWHVPLTQTDEVPQTRPQVPQFVPSVRVSTHAAPQRTRPVPQFVSIAAVSALSITSGAATASSAPPSGAAHWQAP